MNSGQYAGLPALEKSIVQFMLDQPAREEGLHVAAIARYVAGLGNAGDAHGIRSVHLL